MWKLWSVSLVFLLAGCASQREAASPYHTPPGFTVESAASPALADSFVAFTFDSLGRPVVSTEAGHPSTLYDTDHDGIYDSSKPFTDRVSKARGLWFDGRTLYLIGEDDNHQSGLWRAEDTNGDDVADKVELIAAFHPAANEPGPYAIRRAPDGEPTFLLADAAALPPDSIDAASPFQGGRTALDSEGGALVRFNREQRNFSLLLGGLHNVSGQAYNLDGEAFTVDGDAEADADLPGSSPARIVHAVPGADYGWRAGAATLPGYYLDTLPPVQDLGRAAPVALDVYQHHVYPDPYRGALFEADAHGRIVSTPIVLNGATYRAANPEPAEFVQADSLPVTALETGPDGFLYFTTAGAKGNLFRVRYTAGFVETHLSSAEPTGVTAVVRQPQPLSSWGWAAVEKAKADLGSDWQASLTALVQDANAAPEDRIQALLTLEKRTKSAMWWP